MQRNRNSLVIQVCIMQHQNCEKFNNYVAESEKDKGGDSYA